ncbi:MAG: hypothetical protein ACXABY_24660 [Candidatus Thorarchaeota archaeon]|jgi:hypothetical protein
MSITLADTRDFGREFTDENGKEWICCYVIFTDSISYDSNEPPKDWDITLSVIGEDKSGKRKAFDFDTIQFKHSLYKERDAAEKMFNKTSFSLPEDMN